MNLVRVSDIATQIRGVTFSKGDSRDSPRDGYLPVVRANNIKDNALELSDLVYVPVSKIRGNQRLQKGDVVVSSSSGSLSSVGKAAYVPKSMDVAWGAFVKVLRPGNKVDGKYFSHFFRTNSYRQNVSALAAGVNINNLKKEHLDNLKISLPPLPEQQRIARILDQADAIRTKRHASLALFDELVVSVFRDWRAAAGEAELMHLQDVAVVTSGITKGRRVNADTREVPYVAVANVQDGYLDLRNLKSIEATEAEIRKYSLKKNDLLLTEGGDPDKLGRGALWSGQEHPVIHQNHIFRVRMDPSVMNPEFLSQHVRSQEAKNYFLRSAKQTTGIASINMSQLKMLPVPVPPIAVQQEFAARVETINAQRALVERALEKDEELFASLQSRAFSGEL